MAGDDRKKKGKALPAKSHPTPAQKTPETDASPTGILGKIAGIALLFFPIFPYQANLKDPFLSVRFTLLSAVLLMVTTFAFTRRSQLSFHFRHPLTKLFFGALGAFFAWGLICAFQAVNAYESLFFLSRWLLLSAAIGAWYIWGKSGQLDWVYPTLSIFLLIHALAGIMQYYNIGLDIIPGNLPPYGFSGNRNLYGSFLMLLLPFAVVQTLRARGPGAVIGGLGMALGIYALILSQTRSAWIGFLVGGAFFVAAIVRYRKQMPIGLLRRIAFVSAGSIAAFFLFFFILIKTDASGDLGQRLKERIYSLISFEDEDQSTEAVRNMKERLYVWGKTVNMVKDHPITGVGPGNWRIVFPLYGSPPALPDQKEEIDRMMVRPHHMYLQIAGETGIPGVLLFYTLGVLLLIAGFRLLSPKKNPDGFLPAILLTGALFSLSIDMTFSFPLERTEHAMLLTLICGIFFSQLELQKGKVKSRPISVAVFLIAIPFLAFCIFLGKEKWKFDYYIQKSIVNELKGRQAQTVKDAELGKSALVKLGPICDPMELHTARGYLNMQQYDKALQELEKARQYNPYLHRIFNTIGAIYLRQERYKDAIDPLEKSLQYCPDYRPSLINLAYGYYRIDDYAASKKVLEKIDITPKDTLLQKLNADVERRLALPPQNTSNNGTH